MKTPRILIVDDDRAVREALQVWFSSKGFEADEAIDGLDGLDKARGGRYDAIIMDLEMPRMGGREAIEEIRAILPFIPIVVLTGFSLDSPSTLAAGANRILAKPVRLNNLENEVRALMSTGAVKRP